MTSIQWLKALLRRIGPEKQAFFFAGFVREQGGKLIRCVYRSPKFDRQLVSLRKAGKKAAIAAGKADGIVHRLIQGCRLPDENRMVTNNGEYRIRKCVKYDLGGGYRLITIWRGEHVFVSYIGTHDECDRWIENNRRLQIEVLKERSQEIPVSEITSAVKIESRPPADDDPCIYPIDEKYLRMIFCGLSGSV